MGVGPDVGAGGVGVEAGPSAQATSHNMPEIRKKEQTRGPRSAPMITLNMDGIAASVITGLTATPRNDSSRQPGGAAAGMGASLARRLCCIGTVPVLWFAERLV